MPRQARPRWSKSNRAWYANVGPPDAQGRATEVYFREPCGGVVPSSGPGDECQAFRWLDAYQASRRAGVSVGSPTFLQIAEAYLERAARLAEVRPASKREYPNLRTRLVRAAAVLGDRPAAELNAADHKRLMDALRAEGLSANSICTASTAPAWHA